MVKFCLSVKAKFGSVPTSSFFNNSRARSKLFFIEAHKAFDGKFLKNKLSDPSSKPPALWFAVALTKVRMDLLPFLKNYSLIDFMTSVFPFYIVQSFLGAVLNATVS
ncbi:unnamed protein product [Lepeophtheirus salmonis]|uniref:(salmon louse) hypothetical protein n=1 Tax=Lepeophtheirus salmonis TaxID=72036 RepID=A0A7R8CIF8_LEPSM|nr:unnamed protein product [Lepeophtheirus salmonis]CAF2831903.1 unnamed protein product [Lepeophtheirus salmonis]